MGIDEELDAIRRCLGDPGGGSLAASRAPDGGKGSGRGMDMILVCGEALIDFVPRQCGGESGYVPHGGGSPYNVGIGLGRLGVPVGFLGRLSRDHFGRMLRARLESNGVDTRFAGEGDELSTLAIVHLTSGDEPEYAFYGKDAADVLLRPDDLPAAFPADVTALHFGSISLLREPGASTFEGCMRREHGRRVLSLDPNVRPGLITDRDAYIARLEGWVSLMDMVKVSRVDLAWLYPDRSIEVTAARWLAMGPGLMVVTLGADGASGFTADEQVTMPGVSITIADTVGAGDAFTAGLLAWLHDHGHLDRDSLRRLTASTVRECLGQANRIAAMTCTRSGAEPPDRAQMLASTVL
jgi:fructokinase